MFGTIDLRRSLGPTGTLLLLISQFCSILEARSKISITRSSLSTYTWLDHRSVLATIHSSSLVRSDDARVPGTCIDPSCSLAFASSQVLEDDSRESHLKDVWIPFDMIEVRLEEVQTALFKRPRGSQTRIRRNGSCPATLIQTCKVYYCKRTKKQKKC